jgi:hypothetical protein
MPRASQANDFVLTLLCRDPEWIRAADQAGIERIGIDIERHGKRRRQASIPGARISSHRLDDLKTIARIVKHARVFARLNPIFRGTRAEIERALDLGAESLMLPQFERAEQGARVVEFVDGRAEVVLLLETAPAVARVREIAAVHGVAEIMIGLNDLALALALDHPMELVGSGLMEHLSAVIRAAGRRFGFGGVADPRVTGLPFSPDRLLARHAELCTGSAWIARSFFAGGLQPDGFAEALASLRSRLAYWRAKKLDGGAGFGPGRRRLAA